MNLVSSKACWIYNKTPTDRLNNCPPQKKEKN